MQQQMRLRQKYILNISLKTKNNCIILNKNIIVVNEIIVQYKCIIKL